MIEKDILKKLYAVEGKKQRDIAKILNTTQSTVSYYCKKYKLKQKKWEYKNSRNHWTKEDEEKLAEMYGSSSYKTMSKMLGRTEKSIETKKNRLGLGEATKASEYLTANELAIAINRQQSLVQKWIKNKGLPATKKVLSHEREFYRIDVKKFWKWAYENSDLMAWERYEINSLPNEPKWLLEEKKKKNNKSKNTRPRWNETDVILLTHYYNRGIALAEIAKKLNRTMHSIDSKLVALGTKRKEVHIPFSAIEETMIKDMRGQGITFREIAEELGRGLETIQKKYKILMSEQKPNLLV